MGKVKRKVQVVVTGGFQLGGLEGVKGPRSRGANGERRLFIGNLTTKGRG